MWAQSGGQQQQQHYQGPFSPPHMPARQQPPGRYPHPPHYTHQQQQEFQGQLSMGRPPQQPYGPPHMNHRLQGPPSARPPYGGGLPPGGPPGGPPPQPLMSILTVPPHLAPTGACPRDIRLPDFSQPPPPLRQPPPVTIRPRPPTQILKRSPQAPAYRGSHSTGRLPNSTRYVAHILILHTMSIAHI